MDSSALSLRNCPAPAKLNLFLHITGRRDDGYHLLQTAFRLLSWCDLLHFVRRDDGCIRRSTSLHGIAPQQDLSVRAATLLQQHSGCPFGVDIDIDKRLPLGGGVGGGSSDAATTLIALNRLWQTGLSRAELGSLALQLGADVPFFIFGRDAFAEGIGERLQPLDLAPAHYVVITPQLNVPTAQIFSSNELTRNSEPIIIANFAENATHNDLQSVACRLFPEIAEVLKWLSQFAPAKMSGSGASVFAAVKDNADAERIIRQSPPQWRAWKAISLRCHPLYGWVDD